MSDQHARRCWRCERLALMEWHAIFCSGCQAEIDAIARWRLAFWEWFGLARSAKCSPVENKKAA